MGTASNRCRFMTVHFGLYVFVMTLRENSRVHVGNYLKRKLRTNLLILGHPFQFKPVLFLCVNVWHDQLPSFQCLAPMEVLEKDPTRFGNNPIGFSLLSTWPDIEFQVQNSEKP